MEPSQILTADLWLPDVEQKWGWQGRVKDEARSTSKADGHRAYQDMIIRKEHLVVELTGTRRACLRQS
jgi:hypothetical protein